MKVKIRAMARGDIPQLARMEKEIFSNPWSEETFAALLERSYDLYLVAETDGHPVGCAGMVLLGEEGDIDKVMVAPEYRGKGIASELMRELLAEAGRRGAESFTLEVRAGNVPAIRLYEKYGFVTEGVRPRFYEKPEEDALIMWLRPTITKSEKDVV